jgi:phage gpG-like protein
MIEVTAPDTRRLQTQLNMTRRTLVSGIAKEIKRIAVELSARIKGQKLSGQVLKVQTGRLRRSINWKYVETETGVEARVGTNVEYARFHEFGFNGTVNVKEHIRNKKLVVKVRGQATYDKNGKMRLGRLRKMELIGDAYTVKAHTRKVNMPARPFLRSSMADMRSDIESRIARVVADSVVESAKARGAGDAP